MSDLPERIWVDKSGDWYIANFAGDCTTYIRADLTPTVGPLVEALERIVEGFFGENERKIAREALSTINWVPTLHPDGTTKVEPREFYKESAMISKEQWDSIQPARDPEVLVEALEKLIPMQQSQYAIDISREALAEWNSRQPEVVTVEVPIPTVDFFEVAGEWSVKEGFTTWYEEHGAVVRNFCRYLTKSRGGV